MSRTKAPYDNSIKGQVLHELRTTGSSFYEISKFLECGFSTVQYHYENNLTVWERMKYKLRKASSR